MTRTTDTSGDPSSRSELGRTTITIPLDQFDGIHAVRILSREISRELQAHKGLRLLDIARRANLSRETVSRIHARETVQPRHYTVMSLFHALGFSAVKLIQEEEDNEKEAESNVIGLGISSRLSRPASR